MDRLRAIVDAGVALASELSLDAVLQKIVETAAELTDAQYAALGVIDPSGRASILRRRTRSVGPHEAVASSAR
jgi:GAF domain-containing protein